MASLHAFTATQLHAKFNQVSIHNQQRLDNVFSASNQHKWTYVIANNLACSFKQQYMIRLPKPERTELAGWIEKIICAGQCAVICVEQLDLDDISKARIMQLCVSYNVMLVNITLTPAGEAKIIKGPWLNA